jgi:hypothetical protein
LRASPQAKASFLRIDFSEIHGHLIMETSHSGHHVQLTQVSVLTQYEISASDIVMDEAIGLRTDIRLGLYFLTLALQENLVKPHLGVVLVAKRVKFLARLGSRHIPSSLRHLQRGFSVPVEQAGFVEFWNGAPVRTFKRYTRIVKLSTPIST